MLPEQAWTSSWPRRSEAGGHNSRITTMLLVPQVADAVSSIPVLTAGGIGDGRGLVAGLVLGAVGVWCGTVFIATEESLFESHLKQRILEGTEDDTVVTRVMKNALVDAWEKSGVPALPMPLQAIAIVPKWMRPSGTRGQIS